MKNVLFASTALVAFSGAAVADVALSGRAEMGLFGSTNADIQFFTDIDVTFTMTGETDNGLSFGASVDLDEGGSGAAAVADNADDGGIAIFVRGDFGTVTLGDTDGALDWALTEAGNVGNPGSIADDETSHAGYVGSYGDGSGGDGQILRYDFTAGDFGVAVSVEGADTTASPIGNDYGFALGLKYNLDLGGTTIALGLGFQNTVADEDIVGISATANLDNGFSVGVVYSDWSDSANDNQLGLGIGYTTGPISLHANYGKVELASGADVDGFGLAAAYDLGGGAVAHFGYRNDDAVESASIGLGLSF
jgi:outer membrane protein OmpU